MASVSAMLAPNLLKAASIKKDIGLQLYTVRDAHQQRPERDP